jgi:site-specific recombinase XerD
MLYADGVGEKHMSDELKNAFVQDVYGSRKKAARDYAARCAEMLLMVQEYGTVYYKRPSDKAFPGALSGLYEDFCSSFIGCVKESTLVNYRVNLMVSAKYLAERDIFDVNAITSNTIVNFTITLSRLSAHTAKTVMRLFSQLLNYAHENGFSTENKSHYCMKVRFYAGEKIPPVFTISEIGQLLESIDRSTTSGKRDYAMIMLGTRTGLRPCDIIGLKMKHLRFDTDTIEISQQKTGKMLSLPLTEEVGAALIDYLRNGRPESDYDNIFLRHRAPYKPFDSRGNKMIARHMKHAGIDGYKERQPGFRAFRHSLASSMLENNVSIYNIQGILGHESPDTTMKYIKIDTKGLKNCALEVPIRQS